MFRYLSGKLVARAPESVTIEILGIGFQVMIAPNTYEKLPTPSTPLFLHVAFIIREFSQTLYGFLHEAERDLFERLLDVSGVGPKLALNIIGHLSFDELQKALYYKEIATLCRVPGIGKKTAERLLLELKGLSLPVVESISIKHPPILHDAVSALVNLGYPQNIAQKAVAKTLESAESPQELALLITESLRLLS